MTRHLDAARKRERKIKESLRHAEERTATWRRRLDAQAAEIRHLEGAAVDPDLPTLTVRQLRERIADHARAHRTGVTDIHWLRFRAALAELARRATVEAP